MSARFRHGNMEPKRITTKTLLRDCISEPELYGDLVYKKKIIVKNDFVSFQFTYQSFASPSTPRPGNSGAFNFSIFKARLKARHCRARFVVKPLLKAPAPRGLTIAGSYSQTDETETWEKGLNLCM